MGRGLYKRKLQRKNESEQIQQPAVKEISADTAPAPCFKVKVTHPSLRIRRAPSLLAGVVGLITDFGIYDIYDTLDGWGKLADETWIMLKYTEKLGD